MALTNDYVLAIGAGLYAGTSQGLPAGTYVIGGVVEADVVLIGENLAPRHAIVIIDDDKARVEALADGVSLAGYGALKVGHPVTVTLPFELSIAGVVMSWTRAASKSNTALAAARDLRLLSGGRLRSAAVLSVAVVIVAAIASNLAAVATGSAGSFIDLSLHPPMSAAPSGGSARPERAAQLSAQPAGAIKDAAEELTREVEKVGLLNVTVEAGSGVVMARGSVEPGVVGQWQNVQQWFDQRFKGEVLLVNGVAVKAEKLPSSLAIEAVWRGAQSHLVIRGQKYLEGAILDDGWTIQHIEAERVVLKRDGRLVAVRY
ncbi:hypothetical protein OZ411_03810 [Bradyrhizobium sp. Arg237L]|uniref:SctD/MshK family protein n=1 Tax=Bradyrhizobium sp. Arg237L TaxID=3003352 RepID=UPI00249E1E9D|nr:hypothetical protein [Bradyrhizobium sp. Arg237L]MDI4231938.1 hypothetical protein [Bradyrhizobium sp. Arg237L]